MVDMIKEAINKNIENYKWKKNHGTGYVSDYDEGFHQGYHEALCGVLYKITNEVELELNKLV